MLITKELLELNNRSIIISTLGNYLYRVKGSMSYNEMAALLSPQLDDRTIWYILPGANSDLFFSLVYSLEPLVSPTVFVVFRIDKPGKIGLQHIGILEKED